MSISNDARVVLEQLCKDLDLNEQQCQLLEEHIPGMCKLAPAEEGEPKKRKRSRWQECIHKERAGKPFDKEAIKKLARLYREGKCP